MRELSEIGEIISYTSMLARSGEWETLNDYVDNFDYATEDPVYIISVLRSTYAMRDRLSKWADAVARASAYCSEGELRGLLR